MKLLLIRMRHETNIHYIYLISNSPRKLLVHSLIVNRLLISGLTYRDEDAGVFHHCGAGRYMLSGRSYT